MVSVWLIFMVLNQRNLQYVEAQEIALNGNEVTLNPGGQEQLYYSIYPHNAGEQEVKWSSSNPGVVSVSNGGKLTALAAGESIIVVSNGEASGACRVTVTENIIATSEIALLTQGLPQELAAGAKLQFKARVLPVNASNKLVNWQVSDSAIADITADGCLTALKPGSVRVTAQTGEFSAFWDLQIVEGLGFWQDRLNLAVGESEVLLPLPQDSQLSYFSQDENIAMVDQRGKVTAVGVGQTEIVAANSDFSTSCPVVVTANQIESLTLNLSSLNLVVGEKRSLTAEVKPDNTRVRWSSNNLLVAMVNQQGQVTANSIGTALITARVGDLEAGCQVTVDAAQIAVKEVILTPEVLDLETGNQANLTLEILPENADDKTVIWSSKNANIAVVSNGKVTARDPGTTSITATVAGKSANCLVTVLPTNLAFNVESTVSGEISDLAGGSQIKLKNRSLAYPISENVVLMSADNSQSFNLGDLYVGMQVILGLDDEKQVVQIIVN
ncbi:MAG: Ig-like domain-containing protein [Clostridia bacterium]|nr:Ig-like domain-containing protein [Clostridia bacterium]